MLKLIEAAHRNALATPFSRTRVVNDFTAIAKAHRNPIDTMVPHKMMTPDPPDHQEVTQTYLIYLGTIL